MTPVRTRIAVFALLSASPLLASPKPYGPDGGPYGVGELTQDWTDAGRDRVVPVKVYLPEGDGPFPVILFSHGLGGSRDGYSYLGRHWASHGYVSVHLQHVGSDDSVWKNVPAARRMAAMRRAAADVKEALNRPKDVTFAIDRLSELNTTSDSPLAGKLDLEKVGVAGHSYGAYTALAAGGQTLGTRLISRNFGDPRVKAIIPMSAPVPGREDAWEKAFATVRVPSLHMTGTKDDSPIGDTGAEQRRVPFDKAVHSERCLIIFRDGDHMIFSGRPRGLDLGDGSKDAMFQDLIKQSCVAFWDAYLKGDAGAKTWLREGGFAEVLADRGTFEVKAAED